MKRTICLYSNNSRLPSLSLWSDLPASYWRGGWTSLSLLLAGLHVQAEARLEAGGGQDAGRSLSEAPASPPWNLRALHTPLRSWNQKLYLYNVSSTWQYFTYITGNCTQVYILNIDIICSYKFAWFCPTVLYGSSKKFTLFWTHDKIWFTTLCSTLQMKGRWKSYIHVWFPIMDSQKWNCYFQNRIIMFCLPVPMLIYLWEIYIFPGSVCLFCCREICGPFLGIDKSLTDIWMWKLGLRPRNSQKRNT